MNKIGTDGSIEADAKAREYGLEPDHQYSEQEPYLAFTRFGVRLVEGGTDPDYYLENRKKAFEAHQARNQQLRLIGCHGGSHLSAIRSACEKIMFERGYVPCEPTWDQLSLPTGLSGLRPEHMRAAEFAREVSAAVEGLPLGAWAYNEAVAALYVELNDTGRSPKRTVVGYFRKARTEEAK